MSKCPFVNVLPGASPGGQGMRITHFWEKSVKFRCTEIFFLKLTENPGFRGK
jgi:hypothetical protein